MKTKESKEKIFEMVDLLKDIACLDNKSLENIKFVIGSYKEVRRKINEVCKKHCLDVGIFEHHQFILEKLTDERFEHFCAFDNAENVLNQMYIESEDAKEQKDDKTVGTSTT